jgi:hypothetical protein
VKIRFEGTGAIQQGASAGIVLGYDSESEGYLVAGLGAFNTAYSVWEFVPATGWVPRKSAGAIRNLRYDREYHLEITQKGQRVILAVDDVPVLEHVIPNPPPGNQLGLYAMANSAVAFRDFQVQRRPPMAFVVMQFGEPYDTIYRSSIRPKARALGFDVVRSDEVSGPGIVFQDIQKKIEDAKVVIADISAPNQNVYYEVGYAHALKKPTILLAERSDKQLPFDIRSYRVIFYENSIGGKPTVEKTLEKHLRAIMPQL